MVLLPLNLAPASLNQLLASLPAPMLDRLQPHLEKVPMALRQVIEEPGKPIPHVFFPLSGITSVVAGDADQRIEIGIIGRDGMTGVSLLLGADRSPHQSFVQIAGDGLRIAVGAFKSALDADLAMHKTFLLYARSFMLQTAQTALANGRFTIKERLARWLLMTQDRTQDNEIPLTHEFLSVMLGVRRPGVTIALHSLEGAKLIRNRRGRIVIRDRPKLTEIAGVSYGSSA